MTYRLYLKHVWWKETFTTGTPKYLYYDFTLEHFAVGSYGTAMKNKFEFTDEELKQMERDYDLSLFEREKVKK